MSLQRMLPFILINILVSALTVVAIWTFLERRQPAVCSGCETVAITPIEGVSSDVQIEQPEVSLVEPTQVVVEQPVVVEEVPQGPPVHVVAPGEVLSVISAEYDVGILDIVEANGLADVNSIFVGQELIIPVESAVPVATLAPAATPIPEPTVGVLIGASSFEIGSVTGVGDVSAEQVLVVNVGSAAVELEGWTLSNDAGSMYTFGETLLFGDGAGIIVHTGSGDNSPTDLYWGSGAASWASGQVIVLRDAAGNLQAEFAVP